MAVLYMDLDDFKRFRLPGPPRGDQLLVGVAERVGPCCPPRCVRSLRGDEFAMLLEEA